MFKRFDLHVPSLAMPRRMTSGVDPETYRGCILDLEGVTSLVDFAASNGFMYNSHVFQF